MKITKRGNPMQQEDDSRTVGSLTFKRTVNGDLIVTRHFTPGGGFSPYSKSVTVTAYDAKKYHISRDVYRVGFHNVRCYSIREVLKALWEVRRDPFKPRQNLAA